MRRSKCEIRNVPARDMRIDNVPVWNQLDWQRMTRQVRQLQARIVKAQQQKRFSKVRSLSRILTRSFAAKALAVKQVSSNRGARTPGVDGEIWHTHQRKAQAILELQQEGYRAKPLRRHYIRKANGKQRPLGIPTMKDRAMQALYAMALTPIAETTADSHSYGFRPGRSCQDAMDQISKLLCKKKHPEWVLEGDIKGCFDNISHDWILAHIPMEKDILRQWLQCGYLERGELFPTQAGTPQGGIISPTIANMVLDGLEFELYDRYKTREVRKGKPCWVPVHQEHPPKINFVRYADDFIVTGATKEILENEVKPSIRQFLKNRGLILSEEKTVVTNVESGFDFLGFNVRTYKGKLVIKPAKARVERFQEKVSETIKRFSSSGTGGLIQKLNPILRGWTNYYRFVSSKLTFGRLSHWTFYRLWNWAKRRHNHKSRRWIKQKYFTSEGNRNWVFFHKGERGIDTLFAMELVRITRHVKIVSTANPFATEDAEYFAQRKQRCQCARRVSDPLLNRGLAKQPVS